MQTHLHYTKRDFESLVAEYSIKGANLFHDDNQYQALLKRLQVVKNKKRRVAKSNAPTPIKRQHLIRLNKQKRNTTHRLHQRRKEIVDQATNIITSDDTDVTALIEVKHSKILKNKQTYRSRTATSAEKLVQKMAEFHIRSRYRPQSQSRHDIVKGFTIATSKNRRYAILRGDIKNFFESVSHKELRNTLDQDLAIDTITYSLVAGMLNSYNRIADNPGFGLPRGIGLSSALADYYLQSFDRAMVQAKDVVFYSRYVDDFVIVFSSIDLERTYKDRIEELLTPLQLKLNRRKTQYTVVRDNGTWAPPIEYLGYRISKNEGANPGNPDPVPTVDLSDTKFNRYKKRIDAAIDNWEETQSVTPAIQESRNQLLKRRLQFLTSNYRIYTGPRQTVIGLYYSNRCLTPGCHSLVALDEHLSNAIDERLQSLPAKTIKDLRKISFERSFCDRRISKFKQSALDRYTHCWKGIE